MATLTTQLQVRRDTAANLANKVLLIGEPAYATDTKKFSIGDGVTVFSKLQDYGFIPSEADTLQTVTTRGNTTNNIIKIQNGAASGAFVLGADVNAKTLTVNQRKLGRMGVPSYDSNGTKTIAGISFDSQPTVNYADFGGHPNNTASIAPDVIRFIVANSHDNAVNGARTLALQISKQDGLVDIAGGGTSVAAAKFFVPVKATSTITGNEGFIHGGLTAATGKTKNDYILLAGGGSKAISDFASSDGYLPLAGGTMTGAIVRHYTAASDDPVLKIASNNFDINIFKVYSGDQTYKNTGVYGYNLVYNGTGSGVANNLTLNCDNQNATTQVIGWQLNQAGQMGIGTSASASYRLTVNGSANATTLYENGTSLANKYAAKSHNHDAAYLGKTTYEWNKEYAAGRNGAVSLGRYNLYDSQLTFDITTTTSFTLSGKLVIASQNGKIKKVTIYGDASNVLAGYLTIYQSAITNNRSWVEVFCNFPGWSKNKVHIYAVALNSATVTRQMTSVTFSNGVPSGVTSGDSKWIGTIVNDITSNCAAIGHTHDVNITTSASTDTSELTLAHGTKYTLTAGGQSFIFTTPADNNSTYGADRGISLKDGKFGHSNTAVTAVTTAGLYKIKYDAYGHITGTESFTLPTVNNGTLTIQKNGTKVATFTANQSGNTTANITVPTKVSELTNDSNFLTAETDTLQTVTTRGATTDKSITALSYSVNSAVTMEYDSSYKALKFVFA